MGLVRFLLDTGSLGRGHHVCLWVAFAELVGRTCPSENASPRRVHLFPSQASVLRERKQIRLHPWGSTRWLSSWRIMSEILPAAEPQLPHPGKGSPCFLVSVAVQVTSAATLPTCASALLLGTWSAAWEISRKLSLSRQPQEVEPLLLQRLADLELLGCSSCLLWLEGNPPSLGPGQDLTFGEKLREGPGDQGLPEIGMTDLEGRSHHPKTSSCICTIRITCLFVCLFV